MGLLQVSPSINKRKKENTFKNFSYALPQLNTDCTASFMYD